MRENERQAPASRGRHGAEWTGEGSNPVSWRRWTMVKSESAAARAAAEYAPSAAS
jgi:hypothetical protein